jgi:hypothetical protein
VDRSLRKAAAMKALQDPPQSSGGSSADVASSIEGHGDSGGVATSSSVQGDTVVTEAGSTTGAQRTEKCEDCQ